MQGRYFDGKTSMAHAVEVTLFEDGSIQVAGADGVIRTARLANTRVSERIGDTQRRLHFDDGATCELTDNDTLDAWLTHVDGHSVEHRVFRLERMWSFAIVALLATGLATWLGIRYGVPALASRAATLVPTAVDERLGRESLQILDKGFLEPTKLPQERQDEIRADFARITAEAKSGHNYRLEFRAGGSIGANALALPSGIIIMTDELVELSEDRNEIIAVLAHEVGHVVHRHSLRNILQTSATAALLAGLLGDMTSVSSLIAATPTVLIQAKFSRELETEADDFSYDWLRAHQIPTHHFGNLLKRLEESHGGGEESFSYFSSHPRAVERIRK
jgi:Zn-dependent protease with chaperone function